ncbi:hypothetical protein PGTUg99_028736 [Puccinia graminis f. sp. tritici]|uniref:Uncharacterized protein n=1 Tax=Puccinia graminis f. sp. tritici TaxID=56615 RepID=A0A5B0R6U2_PUCGR|nr:hypothetical protein PGTUg99_028736 [Puccinia graminis f. sp. tritici]
MVADNPPRISAIRWRIPASASGYPPAGADLAADGCFSAQTWRISGYPYPVPREATPPRGIPPGELEHNPARREGFLPTSWCTYQLAGRDSSRRAGMNTLSSGGVSPDERVCTPLLASWIVYQLAGRDSSRRAGMNTLLSGGVSPDQRPTTQASTQAPPPMAMAIEPAARLTPALPAATRPNVTARPATEKVPLPPAIATYLQGIIPARREKPLPTRGYSSQLDVGRNPSRRAGTQSSSPGGIPRDELVYPPSRREGFLPTRGYASQLVGRNSSRQTGTQSSLPGGIPPDELASNFFFFFHFFWKKKHLSPLKWGGYPRGYTPAYADVRFR